MSITTEIDTDAGIVTLRSEGVTTFSEWRAAVDDLLADPRYRPGMCMLSDRRAATDVMTPIFVHSVIEYVDRVASRLRGCGWAVVTRPGDDWGMSRLGAFLATNLPVEIHPFMSRAEAKAWLVSRRAAQPDRTTPQSSSAAH